jgi:hypothetical protein
MLMAKENQLTYDSDIKEEMDRILDPGVARQVAKSRHGMIALNSLEESLRNRLLRRVDWRFLTGRPNPKRALVQDDGMLSLALEQIAEEVNKLSSAGPNSADTAALINPSNAELRLAMEALEPGGVLYSEWYLPRLNGPVKLRRRLERLGFQVSASYWPWPWPEKSSPAFWLPLESPEALRFFLKNRPPVRSFHERLARLILQSVWKIGQASGLLSPVCIAANKPLSNGETRLPPASLPARAEKWGLAENGSALHWLLLTGGLHSTNKAIGLVFPNGSSEPEYVIKMPRRPVSLGSLEQEARALQAIQSNHNQHLSGVPELIFLNSEDDFPMIAETHLPGVPLYTAIQPGNLEFLARQATEWLLKLVHTGPVQPPAAWWERLVRPALSGFDQGYSTVGGREILEAAMPIIEQLGELPMAVEHHDFSPWNVFIAPTGELTVLDWEAAQVNSLPFSDLLYFLTYLAFFFEGALESGTMIDSYRRMLDSDTQFGAIVEACTQEYFSRARLPLEAAHPLRLLTWIRYAVSELNLMRNSSGEPDPSMLEKGLFISLLKTELELKTDG